MAPLVLTAPARPAPDSASLTRWAAAAARPNSPAAGGAERLAGIAGLHGQPADGLARERQAHIETVLIHGGA